MSELLDESKQDSAGVLNLGTMKVRKQTGTVGIKKPRTLNYNESENRHGRFTEELRDGVENGKDLIGPASEDE